MNLSLRQRGFSLEELDSRQFEEVLWYAVYLNEAEEEASYQAQAEAMSGDRVLTPVEE